MNEFIKAESVAFVYPDSEDEIPALRSVTLSVKKGEYIAVLGHNGSGKSTFAKLLNLILAPSDGKLYICDRDVTKTLSDDDVFAVRAKVGMVFQNPDNQLVATLVEEDVAFGPENLGVLPAEIRRRVDSALKTVGMTEYARHAPAHLSGGQKQRVAIAGVIAMMPDCIIFDESTAMLDPLGRQEVMGCMELLNKEYGMTILHITHYMEEAARASRVVVMNDGEVFLDGTPREVFAETEKLRSVGLGVPQGTALLEALSAEGYALPKGVTAVDDCVSALLDLLEKEGVANG